MSTGARPAWARTLLRASKQAGQDAARHRDRPGSQRAAERAVSRGLGRVGHWADRRNPDGLSDLSRRRWPLVVSVGVAVAVLAAVAVRSRRQVTS